MLVSSAQTPAARRGREAEAAAPHRSHDPPVYRSGVRGKASASSQTVKSTVWQEWAKDKKPPSGTKITEERSVEDLAGCGRKRRNECSSLRLQDGTREMDQHGHFRGEGGTRPERVSGCKGTDSLHGRDGRHHMSCGCSSCCQTAGE